MRSILFLATAGGLLAQTASPSPVQLAPVTVEARLLNESPATITRLELGAEPAADFSPARLGLRVANLFIAGNEARSFTDTYALRGLTNTPIFGGPALSGYLDEVPLAQPFTFPADLVGFSVAEVHRGPTQNTRFGRAGSAGVLTLRTPTSAQAGGEVRAGFGDFGAASASVRANSGVVGRGDAFASLGWSRRDGYITNSILGRDIDDKEALAGVARFRFRPRAGTELTFLGTAFRARDGVQPLVPLGGPLFTVARQAEGETNVDAANLGFTAAFDTAAGRLTATTSRNEWELSPYESTLSFGFAELSNRVRQRHRAWSEEIRLASPDAAAVRWQAGVFGSKARTDGAFDRVFGPFPFESSVFRVDSTELAGFGEATYRPSERVLVTAGLRLEAARKKLERDEAIPVVQQFSRTHESTALLPKVGVSFTPAPRTTLFATAGAGYKPGGFSAFTGNQALAKFGPERTRTLEAGCTRQTADERLSVTARGFWYDITGYQIERSFSTSSVADDYLVVNAPRARSVGGEFELAWRATEELSFAADVGVTRVTLREFTDPHTGTDLSGNRAPFVPDYDVRLRADYRSRSGWFLGVEFTANGRTRYTEDGNPFFAQGAMELWDAWLGYETERWRATVFGRNLADEEHYSAITPGTGHGTPGAPRTVAAEFVWKW
ncbi:MAG TPA: TonB-dependent receptor [Opitutaceae bacterium]|nr:TonB-dependent receptor [Opitutaceae bacterium]